MRKNTLPLLAVLTFVIILAACGTFVQASAATRNANIGAACVLLGVAVFWFTNWYLLAVILTFGGLMMWVGNATRRSSARKAVAEAEGAIASLKAQVK